MRSKVKFRHPKWPTSAIVKNFKKIKVAYRCEMDRNEIESDQEMRYKVIFGHPKWLPAAI